MRKIIAIIMFSLLCFGSAHAYVTELKPLDQLITTPMGKVKPRKQHLLPAITWAADQVAINANGSAWKTQPGSIFDQHGLNFKILWLDTFQKMVEMFIAGEIWMLRATLDQAVLAAPVCARNPETTLVGFWQYSFSEGGDRFTVKPGVKSFKDLLKGEIAMMAWGPHMGFIAKLAKDNGVSIKDLKFRFTKELFKGEKDNPRAEFYDPNVLGALVISPDSDKLKSAEFGVEGAWDMYDTGQANTLISDMIFVRKDFYEAHPEIVEKTLMSLFISEYQMHSIYASAGDDLTKLLEASARILLESPDADEEAVNIAKDMWNLDMRTTGFAGNVRYFADKKWPRNFDNMQAEFQDLFMEWGLITQKVNIEQAYWNYGKMRDKLIAAGLTGIDNIKIPKLDARKVKAAIKKAEQEGTIDQKVIFSFSAQFLPNRSDFPIEKYEDKMWEFLEKLATYSGAPVRIVAISDTTAFVQCFRAKFLQAKKELQAGKRKSISLSELTSSCDDVRVAALNTSRQRAQDVMDKVYEWVKTNGKEKGIRILPEQFTVEGYGIEKPCAGVHPKYGIPNTPKTPEDQANCRRVDFEFLGIPGEATEHENINLDDLLGDQEINLTK